MMRASEALARLVAAPIAHRGFYGPLGGGAPENSLGAADAAARAGYAIELDLRLSADGEAMVFHDDTLARMTGADGSVETRTAEALGALRLGGRAEEPLPSFGAFLATVAGRAPLLVELKSDGDAALDARLLARTLALLDGYAGPSALMSFDRPLVAAMAKAAPERAVGLVSEGAPFDLAALGASFVSVDYHTLPHPEAAALRAGGTPVLAWTVKSAAAAAAVAPHVDQITFSDFAA